MESLITVETAIIRKHWSPAKYNALSWLSLKKSNYSLDRLGLLVKSQKMNSYVPRYMGQEQQNLNGIQTSVAVW